MRMYFYLNTFIGNRNTVPYRSYCRCRVGMVVHPSSSTCGLFLWFRLVPSTKAGASSLLLTSISSSLSLSESVSLSSSAFDAGVILKLGSNQLTHFGNALSRCRNSSSLPSIQSLRYSTKNTLKSVKRIGISGFSENVQREKIGFSYHLLNYPHKSYWTLHLWHHLAALSVHWDEYSHFVCNIWRHNLLYLGQSAWYQRNIHIVKVIRTTNTLPMVKISPVGRFDLPCVQQLIEVHPIWWIAHVPPARNYPKSLDSCFIVETDSKFSTTETLFGNNLRCTRTLP